MIELSAALNRTSGFSLEVNLSFHADRVTALYGPSGSGKTTILRLLAGLEGDCEGTSISFQGDVWHSSDVFVPAHERNIGYVFQHLNLFPHLTVEGNLNFARQRRRTTGNDIDEQQIIDLLDLGPLVNKSTQQLSGGEQQRVAIARALYRNPGLLVMDEPMGSIDTQARLRILPYLQRLQSSLDIPLIYVSHSLDEVLYLADFVHVLIDGRVESSTAVTRLTPTPKVLAMIAAKLTRRARGSNPAPCERSKFMELGGSANRGLSIAPTPPLPPRQLPSAVPGISERHHRQGPV